MGNSVVPVRKAEIDKCMKKIFKMLDKYDEELKKGRAKDIGEEEENCTICLNVLIESTTLPCKHRFCIQCMRNHINYNYTCPICGEEVPNYYMKSYYKAFVDDEEEAA